MKRLKFHRAIVAIAMMLIGWLPSFAHHFEVEGIFYNVISTTEVEVTYKGSSRNDYNEYNGSVVIPSLVEYGGFTYSVTSIGSGAFEFCESLTGIQIPNSVTSIGDEAFYDCDSLTSIEIPNSVTSIGDGAFSGCSRLTSIVVDSGNTKYDSRNDCNAIIETASNTLIAGCQTTVIPNSVTSIGDEAFYVCESLKSIEIPNSVTSIGNSAFYCCYSLTSVVIGNNVTSIGNYAFNECTSLTSIEIPNSVTSIGNHAFSWCKSLASIVIGNNVTSIGDYAFSNCTNLTSIKIPNSVTSIGSGAFYRCSGLTSIEIPNSVTSIGGSAFYRCSGLTIIICTATTPPTIESDTFSEYSAFLFVPVGCKAAYEVAKYWENFNITELPPILSNSITLDKYNANMKVGETITLNATILPENVTNKTVEWTSSDETIVVVDENGVVTAIAVGEATITATTVDGSNLSASCKVTVVPTLAVSIELNQTEASVEEKTDLQLTATILPEHTTNKEVAWSSSDIQVASVDNTGLVTMYSAGEVIITATTTDGSNLSATCRINVYSGIDGVDGDNVIVATIGDNVVVKNAKLGSVVNVYSSNGALIKSMTATDGSVVIEAPIKGIYVVAIDGKSFKVMVK